MPISSTYQWLLLLLPFAQDPQVQSAVAKLQQLKEELARLESLDAAFRPGQQGFLKELLESKDMSAE